LRLQDSVFSYLHDEPHAWTDLYCYFFLFFKLSSGSYFLVQNTPSPSMEIFDGEVCNGLESTF
jgi:hypothetical protein